MVKSILMLAVILAVAYAAGYLAPIVIREIRLRKAIKNDV
jgi:hypothetical protein